jgi:enterobactin synthetase component D
MRMAARVPEAPEVVFDRAVAHGHAPAHASAPVPAHVRAPVLARALAVRVPATPEEADALGNGGLVPEEREFAATLPPLRRGTWIGGRIAARIALADLAIDAPPLLANDRGAPLFPEGTAGSISHKRDIAVALVAPRTEGHLGVDLEIDAAGKVDIAARVLTEAEQQELAGLSAEERAREVLLRFSAKEAIYKALDPYVRRYVGFHEVAVWPDANGAARVVADLAHKEGPFSFDVRWVRFEGLVLTSAWVVRR